MTSSPRILISGGGSGGHLIPGLAVIEELKDRFPNAHVTMTVTGRKIEDQVLSSIPNCDVETELIPVPSLNYITKRPWFGVPRMMTAFRLSGYTVQDENPDVVIGLGGMTSVPIIWNTSLKTIPIVLLEQNIVPGRATSWLSRYASLICTTFPETASKIRADRHVVQTGNPLRKEFDSLDIEKSGSRKTVLVLGGSQGAAAINEAVLRVIETYPERFNGWHVIHQTGQPTFDEYKSRYENLTQSISHEVTPFISSMIDAYQSADVIVSRAGATTLSEIASIGRPALLIPYPNAVRDHQKKNAEWYLSRGAVRMIEQGSTATEMFECLETELELLMGDEQLRHQISDRMRGTSNGNARKNVVDEIEKLLETMQR